MSATWTPPNVIVGEIVHWFHGGNVTAAPAPAIVTAVNFGSRSIDVAVVRKSSDRVFPRSGVRHCDDPDGLQDRIREGGWKKAEAGTLADLSHTMNERLIGMAKHITELSEQVNAMNELAAEVMAGK